MEMNKKTDFIIARFNNTYGYLSTGKDKAYGFEWGYKNIIQKLEKKYGEFTYATPEELAVHDHQREWTAKDRIYYNKLKYLYEKFNIQMTIIMNEELGRI